MAYQDIDPTIEKPHRGPTILVLGILGITVCFPLGIIAWVMANTDLAQMRCGLMDPSGRGLTQAGQVLGIVSVAIVLIPVAIVLFVLMIGAIITLSGLFLALVLGGCL